MSRIQIIIVHTRPGGSGCPSRSGFAHGGFDVEGVDLAA